MCTRSRRLHTHPHPSPQIFVTERKAVGNNSHRSGKTGNLLKIPHITNSLVSLYTGQCISPVCLNTDPLHNFFYSRICRSFPLGPRRKNLSPRESRNCQIHSRGIPETFRPKPTGNPQISRDFHCPHPRAHLCCDRL